jgi:hypothetical protein
MTIPENYKPNECFILQEQKCKFNLEVSMLKQVNSNKKAKLQQVFI